MQAWRESGIQRVLHEVIEQDKDQTGLLLLDPATGAGKTGSVAHYIVDELMEHGADVRRMIFMTDKKRNLPHEEVIQVLEENGRPELSNLVLFIDSNIDNVRNNIEVAEREINEGCPSRSITYWERENLDGGRHNIIEAEFIFRGLLNALTQACALYRTRNKMSMPYVDANSKRILLEDAERKVAEAEQDLRRAVSACMARMADPHTEELLTYEQKLELVENNPEWRWVKTLWPQVSLLHARAIFLSTDKAFFYSSPVIAPGRRFTSSEFLGGAVVFIDEFESSKERFNGQIINEAVNTGGDSVSLFRTLFAHHWEDVTLSSEMRRLVFTDPKNNPFQLERYRDDVLASADKIADEVRVFYQFTMDEELATPQLFSDGTGNFVSTDKGDRLEVHTIDEDNHIKSAEPLSILDSSTTLRDIISRIDGIVDTYIDVLALMAERFFFESNKFGRDVTMQDAISAVLTEINIFKGDPCRKTIEARMESAIKHRSLNVLDQSVHARGFDIHHVENGGREHPTIARVRHYEMAMDAETLLFDMCQHALVVGLSATAKVPTVLGNYDLQWLRTNLKDHYLELNPSQVSEIARDNEMAHEFQADLVEITCERVGVKGEYLPDTWKSIFGDDMNLCEEAERLSRKGCFSSSDDYYARAVYQLAYVYHAFMADPNAHAMLALVNRLPRNDPGASFSRETIREIFSMVLCSLRIAMPVERTFCVLGGSDFEQDKKNALHNLECGQKLFIISAYGAAGTAQNLQYRVPDAYRGETVIVNGYAPSDKVDIDWVYLEGATHIAPYVKAGSEASDEEKLSELLQYENLHEADEIDRSNLRSCIKATLTRGGFPRGLSLKKMPSAVLNGFRIIAQAVGRLSRSNRKYPHVRIFVANDLIDPAYIDVFRSSVSSVTPELDCILNEFASKPFDGQAIEDEFARAVRIHNDKAVKRTHRLIYSSLKRAWTYETMERWKALREIVLARPTCSDEHAPHLDLYVKTFGESAASYRYSASLDYGIVDVLMNDDENQGGYYPYTADAHGARLDKFMLIPGLREYFEAHGWATEWEPGRYIISPELWNNIYKGALGEVAGSYVLEMCGHVVDEIDLADTFEKFDFSVDWGTAYIDFKNYGALNWFSVEEDEERVWHTFEKMRECRITRAIIANVLEPEDGAPEPRIIQCPEDENLRLLVIGALVDERGQLIPEAITRLDDFIGEVHVPSLDELSE